MGSANATVPLELVVEEYVDPTRDEETPLPHLKLGIHRKTTTTVRVLLVPGYPMFVAAQDLVERFP